jgi:hypothetical protein
LQFSGLFLADFHRLEGIGIGQPIGVQNAVKVIDLVLENAGQIALCLEAHRAPLFVQALNRDLLVAGDLADVSGDRQTAFIADLLSPPLDNLGIEDYLGLPWFVVLLIFRQFNDKEALEPAHLWGCQTDAVGVAHRLQHLFGKGYKPGCDLLHPSRFAPQHLKLLRVVCGQNFQLRHDTLSRILGFQPSTVGRLLASKGPWPAAN